MKIKNMKKVYACLATITLMAQFAPITGTSYAAESKQEVKKKEVSQKETSSEQQDGLIGYYFKGNDFKDLAFMRQEISGDLKVKKEEVKDLNETEKKIQSVRWMGYITPSESGEYEFSTSSDQQVIMQVDGKKVIQQSTKEKITLEKGKTYQIRIEYVPEQKEVKDTLAELQLSWSLSGKEKENIPAKCLGSESSTKDDKMDWAPKKSLFTSAMYYGIDDPEDSSDDYDGDKIYDGLEVHGYTVIQREIVPWKDEYAKKGYKKYVSNPYEKHTAGDPYTDYQKVMNKMDAATKKEAKHPLVAAYPNVGVNMESVVISKNKDVTTTNGTESSNTISKNTTNSTAKETGWGISSTLEVEKTFSVTPSASVKFSVTGSYNTTDTTTVTIEDGKSDTKGKSWSETVGVNTANTAYLGARIRYVNRGTAPAYQVKPTISLGLKNHQTLATITAGSDEVGNVLNPDEMYPEKTDLPILLNKVTSFGNPITINIAQLNQLEKEKALQLSASQIEASVIPNGDISEKNNWGYHINRIKQKTARIDFVTPEEELERRVAAIIDPDHPDVDNPEITIEEALPIAFDGFEKIEGGFKYKGYTFKELHLITDEKTAEMIKKQGQKAEKEIGKTIELMKVKLNAKMNIQISPKGWVTDDKTKKKYYYDDKGIKVTGKQMIDGKEYEFDKDGVLTEKKAEAGWKEKNGKKYYYENGEMVTGWKTIDGKQYLFESNGVMKTGWYDHPNGNTLNFDESGVMVTGWKMINGKQYLFDESNGVMKKGWYDHPNGNTFNFDESGVMVTGWKMINGKQYLFESNGVMKKGWYDHPNGNTFNFDESGVMVTGWKMINGKQYLFDESNGVMKKGWYDHPNGNTFNFDESGVMVTGWKMINGKQYLFESNGVAKKGWYDHTNGNRYYFGKAGDGTGLWTGEMATGWKTINGTSYKFNGEGQLNTSAPSISHSGTDEIYPPIGM